MNIYLKLLKIANFYLFKFFKNRKRKCLFFK